MARRLTKEEVVTIETLAAGGVSNREIARKLAITEGAVRYRLKRSKEPRPDGRAGKVRLATELEAAIETWVEEYGRGDRPPNVRELYEYLVREHGYEHSYKSVLRYVRDRWGRPPRRTYRRVETVPGAQAQTDWGEYPRVELDRGLESLSVFVMVLSHSRKPAIVWSRRKDQLSWLRCHNEAFRRLGGVPAVNRIDNLKTGISRGAGAWGERTPVYRAYARSLRFHIDACPPRSPEAKGKTEAKVRLCRQLIPPRSSGYMSLEALQEETDERVERWSRQAICPATGLTVEESWLREREHLGELPALPEPFDVVVLRPVHRDCLVHFEGRQYAVPFRYVGRLVEVRGCVETVQIWHDGELLREYPRGTVQRLLLDPSCYEGESTAEVRRPTPLGRLGRRLQEIYEMPVAARPVDLYAALAEAAR